MVCGAGWNATVVATISEMIKQSIVLFMIPHSPCFQSIRPFPILTQPNDREGSIRVILKETLDTHCLCFRFFPIWAFAGKSWRDLGNKRTQSVKQICRGLGLQCDLRHDYHQMMAEWSHGIRRCRGSTENELSEGYGSSQLRWRSGKSALSHRNTRKPSSSKLVCKTA